MRTTYEATCRFPDATSAEEAAKAWRAATRQTARNALAAPLAALLSQLEDAAGLKVKRKEQTVRLAVTLHDDIDEWADDGGGPTTEALWTALKAIGAALGGTWDETADPAWVSDPLLRAA